MAAAFVVFALISAMLVPRYRPDFPAKHMGWFIAACVAFTVAMLTTIAFVAKETEHEAAAETQPTQTEPSEPPPAEPPPAHGDRRRRRQRCRRQGDLRDELRQLPHALGRGHDRHHRSQSRHAEASSGRRRGAGDERRRRHAPIRRHADRAADNRRGRVRLSRRRHVAAASALTSPPRPTWRARLTSALGEHTYRPKVERLSGVRRRGRDSNPRRTFWARTRFPVALLRPTRTPLRVRSEYRWARRRRESMGEPGWSPIAKRRGPADDVDEASETGLWGERNPAPLGPGGGRPRAIVPCHRSQTERGGFTVSVEPSDDAQDVRELVSPDRLSWPRVEPLPARDRRRASRVRPCSARRGSRSSSRLHRGPQLA